MASSVSVELRAEHDECDGQVSATGLPLPIELATSCDGMSQDGLEESVRLLGPGDCDVQDEDYIISVLSHEVPDSGIVVADGEPICNASKQSNKQRALDADKSQTFLLNLPYHVG